MLKKITRWLGREFVELSCEGDGRGSATEEAQAVFARMATELGQFGLSLDHVLRTRLWGRDRASRDAGSDVRFRTLAGGARAASSSYYTAERFDNPQARVALDLVALKTSPAPIKTIREKQNHVYVIVKQTLIAYMGGAVPQIAVEHGRKGISLGDRPTWCGRSTLRGDVTFRDVLQG